MNDIERHVRTWARSRGLDIDKAMRERRTRHTTERGPVQKMNRAISPAQVQRAPMGVLPRASAKPPAPAKPATDELTRVNELARKAINGFGCYSYGVKSSQLCVEIAVVLAQIIKVQWGADRALSGTHFSDDLDDSTCYALAGAGRVRLNGKRMLAELDSRDRQYCIAHELGHVALGHSLTEPTTELEKAIWDSRQERLADKAATDWGYTVPAWRWAK